MSVVSTESGRERWRNYGRRARLVRKGKWTKEQWKKWNERQVKYRKEKPLKRRFEILKRYRFTCQYCGRKAPEAILQIDHIIPRAKGGSDEKSNLTVACIECNIGKSDILLNS